MQSGRQRLVSRGARRDPDGPSASSTSRSQNREQRAQAPPANNELPPYEPLSHPLTAKSRDALEQLQYNHDYDTYKKQIKASVSSLTNSSYHINERASQRKTTVNKVAERRKRDGTEIGEDEVQSRQVYKALGKKVDVMTAEAEIALRELIDYQDELAMVNKHMANVTTAIAEAPVPRPRPAVQTRRSRNRHQTQQSRFGEESHEEEQEEKEHEEEDPAEDVPILAPSDLFEKMREEYEVEYRSKTKRARYETNDYRNFKRMVHDARNPGEDAPPVPHASTWFAEEDAPGSRSCINTTDNANGDDSDEDVVIAGASKNLKCVFTLMYFKEPWTSNKCNHTFEKQAFANYLGSEGFQQRSRGGRGPATGPKKVKCPQVGCDAVLEESDFFLDQVIMNQIKRAIRDEAQGDDFEDDDEDDDAVIPGTQSRPQQLESGDEDEDVVARVKRERQKSRGPSVAQITQEKMDVDVDVDVDD
ncbi:zinc-finger of the MIZ type in Nse subunit-domain-containing protein [Amylocarpus encephaloides]|uniref:Zinc-finger of the MIZ type in Nse subunit-domain-containing protein n=1 Tax=Amylocarpus encephaloides TaxID=45428 RepID=A0A9P7YEA6_9HELO|nr:zinc-finger of the MIZ type in Nse subunit-domain-containing protein [Amylocarpus encephaloides]